MEYLPFYTPRNQGQSAFMESLLQANCIRYFIHSENITRIMGGQFLHQSTIYIHPEDIDNARLVLKDFLGGEENSIIRFFDRDSISGFNLLFFILLILILVVSFYFILFF